MKRIAPLLFLAFTTHAGAMPLICTNASSDSDADGWGWENGQSCQVQITVTNGNATITTNTCPDPDGDGWGWFNNQSCRVNTVPGGTQQPVAESVDAPCIDHDGDGWGWANGASCLVTGTGTGTETGGESVVDSNEPESIPEDELVADDPVSPVAATDHCDTVLTNGQSIAGALTSSNKTVCLRSGRYAVPQKVSFKNNQTLVGLDSADPPIVTAEASRTFSTTQVSNVTIENLILDGNSTGATEFAILVGTGSSNINIRNVTVQNTVGIGVGITGSSNVALVDSTVRNIGLDAKLRQAVWVTSGSRSVLIDGISVVGRANDVAGGDHAITCIDGVHGFTVRNSRSQYAGSGAVAINNCSSISVTDNILLDGREHGVDIVNGSVDAVVRNNTIRDFDRSAMVFDDHSWKCANCGSNPTQIRVDGNSMSNNNRVNLARCRGIAVDKKMVVNPTDSQRAGNDWVEVAGNNTVDSDSTLVCEHIH